MLKTQAQCMTRPISDLKGSALARTAACEPSAKLSTTARAQTELLLLLSVPQQKHGHDQSRGCSTWHTLKKLFFFILKTDAKVKLNRKWVSKQRKQNSKVHYINFKFQRAEVRKMPKARKNKARKNCHFLKKNQKPRLFRQWKQNSSDS